jgi:hypothetical protein
MDTLKLGQIIEHGRDAQRDATHIAVAPLVASRHLFPGEPVGILPDGRAGTGVPAIGIVDPFLTARVDADERFWLFLFPGSITGLRHDWSHPAFEAARPAPVDSKSLSKQWMRAWALIHMSEDYYGDNEKFDPEAAYRNAIEAGENMNVGPYESAADLINDEWWNHWETITGKKGERGEYFSCSC